MNKEFKEKFAEFIVAFSDHKNMVLSTSYNDCVTSRMMSVIQINGLFYFQTDMNSRKAKQILHNKNVSLCSDNIQIDGYCEIDGIPSENKEFCMLFSRYFSAAYELYTALPNERLFVIQPARMQRWIYKNDKPCIEIFDFINGTYQNTDYLK